MATHKSVGCVTWGETVPIQGLNFHRYKMRIIIPPSQACIEDNGDDTCKLAEHPSQREHLPNLGSSPGSESSSPTPSLLESQRH